MTSWEVLVLHPSSFLAAGRGAGERTRPARLIGRNACNGEDPKENDEFPRRQTERNDGARRRRKGDGEKAGWDKF